MSWYREWFNDLDYLTLYQHRDESEAEQIINLIRAKIDLMPGSKILDLACGNGRHSIQLSKLGFKVTGLDLSETLLNIAKNNAISNNLNIDFVLGDMRHLNFENEFDMVVNLFTSFGYFSSDEENLKVIHNIHKALKPNGRFFIDYLNKDFLIRTLEPESVLETNGLTIIQKRKIENNRVLKDIIIRKKDKETIYNEAVTLYSLKDFTLFFDKAGLTLENTFGDYDGSPFSSSSSRLVLTGKK
jgi:SAM-dependent methyltransferase